MPLPCALFLAAGLLGAATNASSAPAPANPADLKEVAPGVLDYHGIRLDKKHHRISFDTVVNQRVGLIEYLLVNDKGKVHESLLSTKLAPHDIHLAMLLIGVTEDPHSNANEPLPPSAIDSAYLHSAPKLKGTPVCISLAWTQNGKRQEASADSWIFNLHTNQLMLPGPWTYNGSLVEDGQFLADQELSIIAVITDPTALANNPREGYDDDQIWQIQEKVVPPIDTPVEISIGFADAAETKP
jgi:hypothetical protein